MTSSSPRQGDVQAVPAVAMEECALIAFGCNDDGQLGRGEKKKVVVPIDSVTSANFPQQVVSLREMEIIAVSCGSRHTMALTSTGQVYSWGWGALGQLGHADLKSSIVPKRVEYFMDRNVVITYISAGGCHSGAVTRNGSLYMWGEAHWGQLGLPKSFHDPYQSVPANCPVIDEETKTEETIVKITCGGAHSAALTEHGRVYMWGRCDSGQLGLGRQTLLQSECEGTLSINTPRRVDGFDDEKVVQVACGAFHSAAVTECGHVFIWGKEDYGMLGVGQTSDLVKPKRLEFFDKLPAARISCGGWHTVVVTKAGTCYAFGRGEYGRLGLGDTRSRYKPTLVEALSKEFIVQAACGGSHTLFLNNHGVAFTVGRTDHGRLGHSDMKKLLVPQRLIHESLGTLPVRQVSAGGAHSIALVHLSRSVASPLITPALVQLEDVTLRMDHLLSQNDS